jgi:CheY-like chemotaxis protein
MKNANVLLVEDNFINQKVAVALLKMWGYTVTIASDGEEALTYVISKEYQIILMDLQMPGMDGYESTSRIRSMEDPYFKNIPIIAFSASDDFMTREQARKHGMTDYISKPLMLAEFQNKIGQYIA